MDMDMDINTVKVQKSMYIAAPTAFAFSYFAKPFPFKIVDATKANLKEKVQCVFHLPESILDQLSDSENNIK